MKYLIGLLTFAARLGIAALFIGASASKFMFFDETSQYMASKGLTMVPLLLVGAAAVEFIGGLSLVLGYKTRLGATLLLLFLIPASIIFHDFWNIGGNEGQLQQIMFLKNLAIFGGLLYVLSYGPGLIAIDSIPRKKKEAPAPVVTPPSATPPAA
jgi:uncharacterized membrane protein YphA (DoxX/SURF4 family)